MLKPANIFITASVSLVKENFMVIKLPLIIPSLVAAISFPLSLFAKENAGSGEKKTSPPSITAACTAATVQSDLAVNNVRCRILLGDMWWDLNGNPQYEIPKGSGLHSIFAGALWIGGVDIGGQLKVAAQTYRSSGNDFWPGPLMLSNASTGFDNCQKYDKHFRITRKEVEEFLSTNTLTPAIQNWPGNGEAGQDNFLAPFFDKNNNGKYEPALGDYPGYDLFSNDGYGDCRQVNCIPVDQLYGDETIWWVFNDNGNAHTETGGKEIGLEIRAQAFGFFTDDEINNMTFYNYRIYNRSTFQVNNCYFGVWCDADLGEYTDDYVGCDVKRGLGYTYNADNHDDPPTGYGNNPPAVGIDFFRGPIADSLDGKDNDRGCSTDEACEQIIMSGFLYYDNVNGVPWGNPFSATHYYNYLQMKWGDGNCVQYGGNGYLSGGPCCSFMYPGTTDEHDWGIGGNCTTAPTLPAWDESLNAPNDRRMLQSAGPFTLRPGAVNVITTGVVWARATSGGALASVKLLQVVDDKAQALFDNCFKVLDGPDAPDLTIRESDKELILYISNKNTSNNYLETYSEFDPLISLTDANGNPVPGIDSTFDFEGYKIYQVKDATVSAQQFDDPDKARLVFQCDVKNGISRLINYEFDQALGAVVPKEKVNGADNGIVRSLRITTDAFATGSPNLVNHKTYYFMAMAYGFNQYKKYQQDLPPNPLDPFVPALDGQKKPYKQGRKNIRVYSAIPHMPASETGGTVVNSTYGSGPSITRMEGNGNGGMILDFTAETMNAILSSPEHRVKNPAYLNARGPVNVKVIDPLNVPDAEFTLKFTEVNSTARWVLTNLSTGEIIYSDSTIFITDSTYSGNQLTVSRSGYEQLIPKWGISVHIQPVDLPGAMAAANGFLEASISFADPRKKWLASVKDQDGQYYSNWIRSGTNTNTVTCSGSFDDDLQNLDVDAVYETVLEGSWAPYHLCAANAFSDSACFYASPAWSQFNDPATNAMYLKKISSVDVVITPDKSKWTRCPVLELSETGAGAEGGAQKMSMRKGLSVDKEGRTVNTGGFSNATDPGAADYINPTGMGWFPGYAVNLETGERLNMAFGENSALINENGRDMLWNPTSKVYSDKKTSSGNSVPVFGGQHYIYIFGHNADNPPSASNPDLPRYDAGKTMAELFNFGTNVKKKAVFDDAMWVNIPLIAQGHSLLETEVTVRLRVARPYRIGYSTSADLESSPVNSNFPMYKFGTGDLAVQTNNPEAAKSALDLIKVVPNPYYAFSYYETSQLDNRVKITNLPEQCTVSIYNLGGTLVRRFQKGEAPTHHQPKDASSPGAWHDGSLDWDLKNAAGIPVSSGVYIVHVNVPGVGEKTVKWFGIMRTVDLDSF